MYHHSVPPVEDHRCNLPEAGKSNLDPNVSRSRALNDLVLFVVPPKVFFLRLRTSQRSTLRLHAPASRCPTLPRAAPAARRCPTHPSVHAPGAVDGCTRPLDTNNSTEGLSNAFITTRSPRFFQGAAMQIHGPLTGAAHATSENLCDLPWTTSLTHSTKDSFTDHISLSVGHHRYASQSHGPCVARVRRIFPIHVPWILAE